MYELGQLLRKARLENNISLDELQETTKIQKRYLMAIEEGNPDILPGSFYVRAFVKSYAEAVGLDPGDVMTHFRSVLPHPAPEPAAEPVRRSRSSLKTSDRWSRWATGIMLWSFFLLIAGLIYWFIQLNEKGSESPKIAENPAPARLTEKTPGPTEQAPTPSPTVKAEQTATPTPIVPDLPEVKLVKSENGVDFYHVSKASKLSIQLDLSGKECWIELDKIPSVDETSSRKMVEQGMLKTGDSKVWEVDQPAYLILGAANAVLMKVNGVDVPTGDTANVRRFAFDYAQS